jgi:hypothetical protein
MTPYVTVALTSLVAYLFAVKRRGRRPAGLPAALGRLADLVGTGAIFALVNLAVAAGFVIGLRALTGRFLSLYALDDGVWLVVSTLQGCLWRLWRDSRPPTA